MPPGVVPVVVPVGGMPGVEGGIPGDDGGMPAEVGGIPGDEGGMPVVVGAVEPEFGCVSPSGSSEGRDGGIGLPDELVGGFGLVLLPLMGFDAVAELDPDVCPNPVDAVDIPVPIPLIAVAPDIAVLMLLPGSPIPGRIMLLMSPPPEEAMPPFDAIDPISPGPLALVPIEPPEAPPELDDMPPEFQFPLAPLSEPL
jgi:hypothetical protein